MRTKSPTGCVVKRSTSAKLAQDLENRKRLWTEVEGRGDLGAAPAGNGYGNRIRMACRVEARARDAAVDADAREWRTDFERLLERSEALNEARERLALLDARIEKQVKNVACGDDSIGI